MNLFLFLVIWAVLWYIPLPPRKFRPASVGRLVSLLIGLFLFFIIQAALTPLSLFVYLLIFSRLFVALIEASFSMKPVKFDELPKTRRSGNRLPLRISFRIQRKTFGVLFAAFMVSTAVIVALARINVWLTRLTSTVLFT